MEIRISKEEILNGDISQIKSCIEKIAPDSRLSAENENNISIKFDKLSAFDLSNKLQDEQYKAWFKKLDAEFPYLTFFLNKQSKTLMFFIMGNINFTIDDQNNINFDETSRKHYIRNRIPPVRIFCVRHNIEYKNAIHNLVAFEPDMQKAAPQKIRVEDLLMKYGSIAYISEQREYVLSILTREIPSKININGVFYTDKNCAQPFFTVFMKEDDRKTQYTVHSQVSQRETEEYLKQTPEVRILVVFKNDDGQLSAFPKITIKVVMSTKEQIEEQKLLFMESGNAQEEPVQPEENKKELSPAPEPEPETPAPEKPQPQEVKETKKESPAPEPKTSEIPETPKEPEEFDDPDKTLPIADVVETQETAEKSVQKAVEETVPENETPEEKIARLERKIAELEETIRQKDNLIKAKDNIIEEYEKAINQKRSFLKDFFKRMFK